MSAIPIAKIKPRCPQCGRNLSPEQGTVNLENDTSLLCPTHGDQGSLQDFRSKLVNDHRGDLVKKALDIARSGWKKR